MQFNAGYGSVLMHRRINNVNDSIKTILILDDEISIRHSFSDFFDDLEWKTIQANSGEMALSILKTNPPDAAIVDIRLGGMDGDAFIRKALRQNLDTAFAICTGSPEYQLPDDFRNDRHVSNRIFRKPVTDMMALEEDLDHIIQLISKSKNVVDK